MKTGRRRVLLNADGSGVGTGGGGVLRYYISNKVTSANEAKFLEKKVP